MNRRAAKAAVIALEAVGVLLAAGAGFAAFIFWRLQSGPVSLSAFRQSAEFAIERALPAHYDATIGKAMLSRSAEPGALDLLLDDVEIEGPAGAAVAKLSKVELTFSLSDLAHGAPGPRRIVIADPLLRIERDADRKLALAYAPGGGARPNVLRMLTGGRYFREAFQSAELVRAHIDFVDAASGRTWRADGAGARIFRTGAGYAGDFEGVFDIDGEPASLNVNASYVDKSGVIFADIKVADAPVGDILSMFYGAGAAVIAAPITGEATITLTKAGEVLSSRLEGRAGKGEASIGPLRRDVSFIDFAAAFDSAKNEFDVEKLAFEIAGSKGEFTGALSVRFGEQSLTPAAIGFDLTGKDLVIAAEGVLASPLPLSGLQASGFYDIAQRRLSLLKTRAELLDLELNGRASFARPKGGAGEPLSPEIKADFAAKGVLDRERLLRAWPLTVAPIARNFVATRMPRGGADNIAVKIDLPAGARKSGESVPDDALALTFDIRDATVVYAPGMTPLSGASGKGRLSFNRLLIDGVSGRVGNVAISDGEADFTAFSKGAPVHYRFRAEGAARDILGVLNEEPLRLMDAAHLDPERFIGKGVVRADIMRPNRLEVPRKDYRYDGTATFTDLTVTEFYGGGDLTGASGRIDIDSTSMTLTADATFGEAPIRIEWTQDFYGAQSPSKFRLSGTVNGSTGDVFGAPLRRLLRGPASFEAVGSGDLGALDALSVKADFTNAAVMVDLFGWEKPQGAPATGALDFAFGKEGAELRSVRIEGEGVDIEGAASFDAAGALLSASFPRLFLEGGAELSLVAAKGAAGGLDIVLTGPFLNGERLMEGAVEGAGEEAAPFDWGEGISIRARVDDLALRAGARYRDASLDLRHGAQRLEALEFMALTAGGAPLSVLLKETGAEEGPQREVEARTDDIGTLFRGVFGVASIRGGRGSMQILVDPDADDGERGLAGVVEARDFRVLRAPLLARIFSAGSLTGLADILNGEGIEFSQASGTFGFKKGLFTLKGARASGPSVGITAEGSIATGEPGAVALNGAVAPLYQVNAILGKAPIIGDILVGREGEGFVALAYQVSGPVDAPVATVNPLSALTPGIFRRMFEPVGSVPAEASGEGEEEPEASEPPAN